MSDPTSIFLGKGEIPVELALALTNRHGLIAGATGTGKTVTLQILAEGFSAAGVPVFAADVKGDLSGIALAGRPKRTSSPSAPQKIGLDPYVLEPHPVIFWDVFGKQGHPIRATISEMGPLLLSRLLDLNDVQEGVLNIAFRVADEEGLLLLDLKDLRAILAFLAEHADEVTAQVRQCLAQHGRRHPARAAGAGEPGRRRVLRRAGARPRRLHGDATRTAAARSTCSPPTR